MTAKELRKQEIAQKIKNLRIASGLTQAQVADRLGITYQAISNYERGKNSIETDLLFAMCNIYGADPITVLQPDVYSCPICGLFYDSSYPPDVKEHNEFHKIFCDAVEYFGDCCCSKDKWAKMKSSAYDILYSDSCTKDEKADALLELIKAYFSRSVSAWGYSLDHPRFNDYVAMLLNQERFQNYDKDAYEILLSKYGKKPGIPENETTYKIQEIRDSFQGKTPAVLPNSANYSAEAMKLAEDYDTLDHHGQKIIRLVANEEIKRNKQLAIEKKRLNSMEKLSPIVTLRQPYTQVAAAEGSGAFLLDDGFDEVAVELNRYTQQADVILKVVGRSMEPAIADGDRVLVRQQPSVRIGEIGVFVLDGQGYLKECEPDRLVSLNPTVDDVYIGDLQQAECYGKFIAVLDPEWVIKK